MKQLIAINTEHDSAISIYDGTQLYNLEMERYVGQRYFAFKAYDKPEQLLVELLALIADKWSIPNDYDICLVHGKSRHIGLIKQIVRAKQYEIVRIHHKAHATAALYESPYNEALIFSYDGGGYDGVFNVYRGKRGCDLQHITTSDINLGTTYRSFSYPISEIQKRQTKRAYRIGHETAGKLMGLAAYGKVDTSLLDWIIGFYKVNGMHPLPLNNLSGQASYDLAASNQQAFEDVFLDVARPIIDQHPKDIPICLTGGAALNVLLNERLRRLYGNRFYVPPNPNDCGITTGLLLDIIRPQEQIVVTYSGLPLLDNVAQYKSQYNHKTVDIPEIANLLNSGKIIGVARGNSEHGPRALGNRSILCDPSIPNMKDILNARVKYREWFRPFAPVVKEEHVSRYFEIDCPSPYMSFAPLVKTEWRNQLPAITHVDNTTRVQTVTRAQHAWLYDLLGEFEKLKGHGVLLNTSFNIKGKPILTRVSDALEVLSTTQIDYVMIDDTLFWK